MRPPFRVVFAGPYKRGSREASSLPTISLPSSFALILRRPNSYFSHTPRVPNNKALDAPHACATGGRSSFLCFVSGLHGVKVGERDHHAWTSALSHKSVRGLRLVTKRQDRRVSGQENAPGRPRL